MITKQEVDNIFYEIAINNATYKDLAKKYQLHHTTLCKYMKMYKSYYNMSAEDKYCKATYLNYLYKDQIICEYINNKKTLTEIAKKYDVCEAVIKQVLLKNGCEIRPSGYESKIDQTLFETITTELEAYVIGLITADGSVNSGDVRICLTKDDSYLLENINNLLLNGLGTIRIQKKKIGKDTCELIFCGKRIVNTLKQYNIVKNKSDYLVSLSNKIPQELMHHYIRGLYDGDGVCSKSNGSVRVGYCAKRKEFVEAYQNFLCNTLYMRKNKVFNTGGCWDCSWAAKSDLIKFFNYIYKDATIFLGRKKKKLHDYLFNANPEVNN